MKKFIAYFISVVLVIVAVIAIAGFIKFEVLGQ